MGRGDAELPPGVSGSGRVTNGGGDGLAHLISEAIASFLLDGKEDDLIGSEPGPVFLYAGLLGLAQGLDQILDAAARSPPEVPGRCVLVGEGPGASKLSKAEEQGVPILDEAGFRRLLETGELPG